MLGTAIFKAALRHKSHTFDILRPCGVDVVNMLADNFLFTHPANTT